MNDRSEKAFAALYDTYADAIFRYCYFKTNDRQLALDLMQETFLKAWKYGEEGHAIDTPKPFLYRLARNLVIDWYRKKKADSLDNLMEQGIDFADPMSRTDAEAEVSSVMRTLQGLAPQDRELIVWRYVDDLSPKEIAKLLDRTENAVSVRIHRALGRLRELMDSENPSDK